MVIRKGAMKTSNLLKEALGISALGRHSTKGKTPSGLSSEGEAKAAWAASHLPKGFTLYASHGEQPRHITTARIAVENYPGAKSLTLSPIKELEPTHWMKNPKEIERLITTHGEEAITAQWLKGELPREIIEQPKIVGEAIVKKALGGTKELILKNSNKPFHLNLTSSGHEAAILIALGFTYENILELKPKKPRSKNPPKPGEPLKETEAMLFFHLPNGKTILKFRGRTFDVTKKVDELLKQG